MACSLPGYSGREVGFEFALACGDVNPLSLNFMPVGSLTTKGFSLTWDTTDASTDDLVGNLRANIATFQTLEVTASGVCKRKDGTKSNQTLLTKHVANPGPEFSNQPSGWARMTFPDLTFICYGLFTECSRTAPSDDSSTFDLSFTSAESDFGLIVLDTPDPNAPPATGVTVTPDELPLVIGGVAQLVATVQPAAAAQAVTFTSDTPAVATVTPMGVVTAIAEGTATITVASILNPTLTDTVAVVVEPLGG